MYDECTLFKIYEDSSRRYIQYWIYIYDLMTLAFDRVRLHCTRVPRMHVTVKTRLPPAIPRCGGGDRDDHVWVYEESMMFHTTFCSVPVLFRGLISVSNTHLEPASRSVVSWQILCEVCTAVPPRPRARGQRWPAAQGPLLPTDNTLSHCLPACLSTNLPETPLVEHPPPSQTISSHTRPPDKLQPAEQTNLTYSLSCIRHLHPHPLRALLQLSLSSSDAGPARRTTFPSTL